MVASMFPVVQFPMQDFQVMKEEEFGVYKGPFYLSSAFGLM